MRSQEWVADTRPWFSYLLGSRAFGMSRNLVLDTCRNEYWVVLGDRIWRSTDSGDSWIYVPLLSEQEYKPFLNLIVGGCNMLCHWEDKVGNFEFRIFAFNHDVNDWEELHPLGTEKIVPSSPYVGLVDSTIILAGLRTNKQDLYYSSNLGSTWDSVQIKTGYRNNMGEVLFEVKPGVVAIARDSGFTEYDVRSSLVRDAAVPSQTAAYRYHNDSVLLVAQEKGPLSNFARSSDMGETWHSVDTVRFANSTRIMYGAGSELKCHVMRQQGSIISAFLTSGDIISTIDGGLSWLYRGKVGTLSASTAATSLSLNRDNDILIATNVSMFVLPHDTGSVKRITSSAPTMQTCIETDSCTYLSIGTGGIHKSVDCATSWYMPEAPSDLLDSSPIQRLGTHPLLIDRVSTVTNGLTFTTPDYAAAYILQDGGMFARYLSPCSYPQLYEFKLNDPRYVNYGAHKVILWGDTILHYSNQTSLTVRDTKIKRPIASGNFIASTLAVMADSDWIAVSDSVYFSSDQGISWRAAESSGLPRDSNGRIYEASQILRLSVNSMLVGLRGIQATDGLAVTEVRPGGIYRTDDNGASWTHSDIGIDGQTYVWSIENLDSTTVLCAVGTVLVDSVNAGFNQTGATIMRSVDAGHTWSVVYDEPRARPAFWGRRELLATSPSRIYYASIEDGVMESTDAGLTWHTLGEIPLYYRFISDIAVNAKGVVYAGTDKGVYSYTPTTSNVEADDESGLFPAVWAYPTPVNDQLTVRISNANLVKGTPKLEMLNLYGQQVYDLSDRVKRTSARQEFNISIGSLPDGVYILSLSYTGAIEWCKVMIKQ